jgi:hypothetical protein
MLLLWHAALVTSAFADPPLDSCDGAGSLPSGEVFEVSADVVFEPSLGLYDMFGDSLAVGDFNGDGVDDVAVGAPNDDVGALVDAGSVHIWFGSLGFAPACETANCLPGGGGATTQFHLTDAADLILSGSVAGQKFAVALASAGDLNGDGADELLVGAVGAAAIVDVAVAVSGPADAWRVLSGAVGANFGLNVGSMEVAPGERVLWVGEQYRVHMWNDGGGSWNSLPDPALPSLTLAWADPPTAVFSATAAIADWNSNGYADFALGCASCTPTQRNVVVFDGLDLLGSDDLTGGADAIAAYSGAGQTVHAGEALVGFLTRVSHTGLPTRTARTVGLR